jgi:hypothetical protein
MVARATRQFAEILAAGDGKARVTKQFIEVLASVAAPSIDVSATDALSMSHEATVALVRVATDTLSLSHVATVSLIKPVADTLTLTDEVALSRVLERPCVETIGCTHEALVAFSKQVNVITSVEIADVAAAERIKPILHTLALTHVAQCDVVRWCTDTLLPTDAASVAVAYARSVTEELLGLAHQAAVQTDYVRSATDSLTLGEMILGDLCRVVSSTLSLTDQAGVEIIRLASDTLALSHEVGSNWEFIRRRADNLALTHAAVAWRVRSRSVDSTVVLTDSATFSLVRSAADTLTLTHAALVDHLRLASDTLLLTDLADATNTRLAVHDDLLGLSHTATVGFSKQVSASDTLRLRHKARSGIEIGAATHTLQQLHYDYDPVTGELIPYYIGLQDQADVSVIRYAPYTATSILSLSDQSLGVLLHADAKAGNVTDALAVTQSAVVEQWPFFRASHHAANSLLLTQTAEVAVVKLASSTLALTHTAVVTTYRAARPAADTLNLTHAVGFMLISADVLHQYHPFIGEGSGPTPPPASCPTPVAGIGECRLCYPVSSPTVFVTLGSPEFGNRDRLQFNRISRETRGGTLIVFADPIWPKVQTAALTFSALSSTQVQNYLTFVKDHLGLEVGFVDWEGFYWKGVIMNPTEPTAQDDKTGHTVSFEFEGESAVWEL